MIKKESLVLLLIVGMLYISNLNDFILSAIVPGDKKIYQNLGYSPELFVGLLVILISIFLLSDKVVFQPLSGRTSKLLIIFILTMLSISLSIIYHAQDLDDFRPLIAITSMLFYFLIGKGFAVAYGEYVAGRLWKWIAPLPLILIGCYLFFLFTGRVEYADIYTLYHGNSVVEGLKPQIEGGVRSSQIAIYTGLNVIFLFYCLHAAPQKWRKLLFLILFLSVGFLIMLLSMGAFLAIGAVVMLYYMQKNGIKGIVQLGLLSLIMGFLIVLFFPKILEMFDMKVAEKLFDLFGSGGNRAYRYALLWDQAVGHPIFGIGWYKFEDVIPYHLQMLGWGTHQNILGMAAQQGFIAASLYTLFFCCIIWTGSSAFWKFNDALSTRENANLRYLLFMAVGSVIFLQLHGLFMETWQIKQNYFWAGFILGLVQRLQLSYGKQPVRQTDNLIPGRLQHARCKLR